MSLPFVDRRDAGRQLAQLLATYRLEPLTVLGVPCGGVPVAYEVARNLGAPLDTFAVRPLLLRTGGHGSVASVGTVGSGGVRLLDRDVIYGAHVPPELVDHITRAARADLLAEESAYRDDRPRVELRGRTLILVDDGTAAVDVLWQMIRLLREFEPARLVAAAPTLGRGDMTALEVLADHVVTVVSPVLHEPARWYSDFTPATAGEVRALLALAEAERAAHAGLS